MKIRMVILFLFVLSGSGLAEELGLMPPSCIRITESTGDSATIKFEPHGGTSFEAERYYNGKWRPYATRIRTTGTENTVIVPLSENLMNIVHVCAISGTTRVCSSEGVYAKR
jgi:hypothetical protein